MFNVTMDLVQDWIKTVKEILQRSGIAVPDEQIEELSYEAIAIRYFQLTMSEEQAKTAAMEELARLRGLENTIHTHLASTILPDIRKRTRYEGDEFHFCWVYNEGEHIVELKSEYRIPL